MDPVAHHRTYRVVHDYDLTGLESPDTGPFDFLEDARNSVTALNELLSGNSD